MRQYGALVKKAFAWGSDVLKLKARAIENRLSDEDIEDSIQNTPDPRNPCDNGTCEGCYTYECPGPACFFCDGKGTWFEGGRVHECLGCGGWG